MAPSGRNKLTLLELQVLRGIARGQNQAQIAQGLDITGTPAQKQRAVEAALARISALVNQLADGWVAAMRDVNEGMTNAQIAKARGGGATANSIKAILQKVYDALGLTGRQSDDGGLGAVKPREQAAAAYRIWKERDGRGTPR